MGQTERNALFLEAIRAGIHGERARWEPLEPGPWNPFLWAADGCSCCGITESCRKRNHNPQKFKLFTISG